jgi:hypothetical protein
VWGVEQTAGQDAAERATSPRKYARYGQLLACLSSEAKPQHAPC